MGTAACSRRQVIPLHALVYKVPHYAGSGLDALAGCRWVAVGRVFTVDVGVPLLNT